MAGGDAAGQALPFVLGHPQQSSGTKSSMIVDPFEAAMPSCSVPRPSPAEVAESQKRQEQQRRVEKRREVEMRIINAKGIAAWEKLLERISTKLANELALRTFEYWACSDKSTTYIKSEQDLSRCARLLLGFSPVANSMMPAMREAILRSRTIRLDITFVKKNNARVAILPPVATALGHHIRHLELDVNFDISPTTLRYPAAIYPTTDGLKSLGEQMPQLQSMSFILNVKIPDIDALARIAPGDVDILGAKCMKGFGKNFGETTYLQAIINLVEAAKTDLPTRANILQIIYKTVADEKDGVVNHGDASTSAVEFGNKSSFDIVDQADSRSPGRKPPTQVQLDDAS